MTAIQYSSIRLNSQDVLPTEGFRVVGDCVSKKMSLEIWLLGMPGVKVDQLRQHQDHFTYADKIPSYSYLRRGQHEAILAAAL